MTPYNPRRHGRTSESDPENQSVADEWAYCHELDREHGGEGFHWVPTASIYLRDDLQPRIEQPIDLATAQRYADCFDLLPPVQVQRGTLTLIDGRHRIRAAYLANPQRYYIRAAEMDIADEELIDYAVRANVGHGRPASAAERKYWAKDFLKRHTNWSDGKISEWTGADRMTILTARSQLEKAAEIVHTTERVGKDGRVTKTRDIGTTASPALAKNKQVKNSVTSSAEPVAKDGSNAKQRAYIGTHFPGGKPAGYFKPGARLVDLSTGAVVTLGEKRGEWATFTYDDGECYSAHISKDLRFAALDETPPPEALPVVDAGVAYPEIRAWLEQGAELLANVDVDSVVKALRESERRYYQAMAAPVVDWVAAFVEA